MEENETEKIVVTVLLAILALSGFIASVFWVYLARKTLQNSKLAAQTHTVISTISHIFTTSILKSICGSTALFCWIWLFYDQKVIGYTVCLAVATLFILLESFLLTLVALNRLNSSRKLFWKWSKYLPWLVVLSAVVLSIASGLLEWFVGEVTGSLLSSSVLIMTFITFISLSIQTHTNIVIRFSKVEQSKSARVLVMSSVAFFLQILPFIVLSFVAYFDAGSRDLYLLIGLLVTHVSAIYNGPLYGLTNQRFKPAYQAAVGEQKCGKQSVTGHTNEAFSDEVL